MYSERLVRTQTVQTPLGAKPPTTVRDSVLSIRPGTRQSSSRYFELNRWLEFMDLPTMVRYLQLLILASDGCCTRAAMVTHLLEILLKALTGLELVHVVINQRGFPWCREVWGYMLPLVKLSLWLTDQ